MINHFAHFRNGKEKNGACDWDNNQSNKQTRKQIENKYHQEYDRMYDMVCYRVQRFIHFTLIEGGPLLYITEDNAYFDYD